MFSITGHWPEFLIGGQRSTGAWGTASSWSNLHHSDYNSHQSQPQLSMGREHRSFSQITFGRTQIVFVLDTPNILVFQLTTDLFTNGRTQWQFKVGKFWNSECESPRWYHRFPEISGYKLVLIIMTMYQSSGIVASIPLSDYCIFLLNQRFSYKMKTQQKVLHPISHNYKSCFSPIRERY